jgi:hypothetical protein
LPSACRAKADESKPALIPPNIVAAVIREPAIPAFRDRGAAARRRWGFWGVSAALDDFGARGMASCIDIDRSVFARQNTFVAYIANMYTIYQYYLSRD